MKRIKKIRRSVVLAILLMLVPAVQSHADNLVLEGKTAVSTELAVTQGDILYRLNASGHIPPRMLRGMGRTTKSDKWDNGLVYYRFDASLSQTEREFIQQAVEHWNQRSSITLLERTGSSVTDFINFESSSGCASWVGKIGGEQAIWIGPNCDTGSMIHEIGHAVGLFHEHTRGDRDSFITVQWENIISGKELNFDIYDDGTELLGDYDYGSIMHYGDNFFSKNGNKTITVPDGITIGQRIALSAGDLASVDKMYQTDLSLVTSLTADEETAATLDVIVTNLGPMGAHDLKFNLPLADDAEVLAASGNDWNCITEQEQLTCTQPVLAKSATTQISIELESADGFVEDAAAYLTSKTHDSDLSNNGSVPIIDAPSQPEPELELALPDLEEKIPTEPETTNPVVIEPNTPDSSPLTPVEPEATPSPTPGEAPAAAEADLSLSEFASAAGASGWWWLVLLLPFLPRQLADQSVVDHG